MPGWLDVRNEQQIYFIDAPCATSFFLFDQKKIHLVVYRLKVLGAGKKCDSGRV